jgi:hypothetical protein
VDFRGLGVPAVKVAENGLLIVALKHQALDLSLQRWKIVDKSVPDDVQVDAEVFVNKDISHAGDVRPRYVAR